MSATAAGKPARRGGTAARQWAAPAAPGRQAGQAGLRQRAVRSVPERRVPPAAPRQRTGPAAPGRRVMAMPGQRAEAGPAQRDVAGARRGRPERKLRTPVLVLVPPPQTVPDERPEVPVPAPVPGAGTEERARRPARHAPARPTRVPGTRTRPRTRLTRRGRIVVSVLVLAAMLLVAALAWIAGATKADAAGSGGPPPSAVYRNLRPVIVQPGESLWAIAVQAEPSADPRGVIQQIIDLNALGGTSVQPGQRLWVPRG
jgi:hypothetical protein